jgi:hypothetical protein
MTTRPRYRNYGVRAATVAGAAVVAVALGVAACGGNAESDRIEATTKAVYDPATGLLRQFTYDKNKNGRIDTWVQMDGTKRLSAVLDENEDGALDRWEEYGDAGQLVRAGWIRAALDAQSAATARTNAPPATPITGAPVGVGTPPPTTQLPNTWAYTGPDGAIARIEYLDINETGQVVVTLREFLENQQVVRSEEDTDGDGVMDKWETYEAGVLRTVEFDDNHDGKRDRRFTYNATGLALIESAPDASGNYTKRVVPGGAAGR